MRAVRVRDWACEGICVCLPALVDSTATVDADSAPGEGCVFLGRIVVANSVLIRVDLPSPDSPKGQSDSRRGDGQYGRRQAMSGERDESGVKAAGRKEAR